jgi:hypothetical protein
MLMQQYITNFAQEQVKERNRSRLHPTKGNIGGCVLSPFAYNNAHDIPYDRSIVYGK